MFRYFSLLSALLFYIMPSAIAAEKWDLKKDDEGIKIYTRTVPNSPHKALRATFTMKGTLNILENILLDISKQTDWVYSTKTSSLVKRMGEHDLVYYSEKSMPWPVTNRDAVVRISITRSDATTMLVNAISVVGTVPEKKGIVRVPFSKVSWEVKALNDNTLSVVYEALVDPGGSLPAWVVNMFSTKGPFETFKSVREISERKLGGK